MKLDMGGEKRTWEMPHSLGGISVLWHPHYKAISEEDSRFLPIAWRSLSKDLQRKHTPGL